MLRSVSFPIVSRAFYGVRFGFHSTVVNKLVNLSEWMVLVNRDNADLPITVLLIFTICFQIQLIKVWNFLEVIFFTDFLKLNFYKFKF